MAVRFGGLARGEYVFIRMEDDMTSIGTSDWIGDLGVFSRAGGGYLALRPTVHVLSPMGDPVRDDYEAVYLFQDDRGRERRRTVVTGWNEIEEYLAPRVAHAFRGDLYQLRQKIRPRGR